MIRLTNFSAECSKTVNIGYTTTGTSMTMTESKIQWIKHGSHSVKYAHLYLNKKYKKRLGYRLSEGDIIKFGRVRFRVKKLGNNKDKQKHRRLEQYDATLDVSMNERLINQFHRKRKSDNHSQNSFDSSAFQTIRAANNSLENENIQEKIAKMAMTSAEQDFQKIRKEAQCRICLGGEEDDEIADNPLISPCS
jgi:hypothetical protein